jgi:acyl-CoA thioesterase-1
LGDSLSAGYGMALENSWPALLEPRLRAAGYPHPVVNASISGETTAGGARRIGDLLTQHRPAAVVIALGANDGLRGIAPDEIARNLRIMIQAARTSNAVVVVLQVRIPPNYGPVYSQRFEQVFVDAATPDEAVLGPFLLDSFATEPSAFQSDGLHPTAAVQPRIVDTVWEVIERALSTAAVESPRT